MMRFKKSVIINRPVETVFAYLSNFENESKWMPGVLKNSQITDGSVGVGTRYLEVSNFMPFWRPKAIYELTEYVHNNRISFKSISGPNRFIGSCRVEPVDVGTRFIYVLDLHMRGMSLLEPIALRIFAQRAEAGFQKLKGLVESST
ncbi:MAG: SRPBCC family protein [Chloroflexia bacterium]